MRHYLHAAVAVLLFWAADVVAAQEPELIDGILTARFGLVLAAVGGIVAAVGWPGVEHRGPREHQAQGVLWRRKMKAQLEVPSPPPPPTEFERPSTDQPDRVVTDWPEGKQL